MGSHGIRAQRFRFLWKLCGLTGALLLLVAAVRTAGAWPRPQEAATPDKKDQPAPEQQKAPSEAGELATRDTPSTFKVRVNLVLVRVVVRDALGKVIENLQKEDFQLFDNRKPQVISAFSVDTPASHVVQPTTVAADAPEPAAGEPAVAGKAVVMPQRFVAVMFDDIHLQTADVVTVRDAATRLFGALQPSDRVGMYTTSGHLTQEFTADQEQLRKSLLGITPSPLGTGGTGFHDCPEVTFYQADQIINQHDDQALSVATEDAVQCAFSGDQTKRAQAEAMAEGAAARAQAQGETQVQFALREMEHIIKRLSGMPGQRTLVLASPGFVESTLRLDAFQLIDRATRANIVIDTIDARGLYAPDLLGDITDPPHDSYRTAGYKASYRIQAQTAQAHVLEELADGTGGTYFHNRNDLDEGLRQAVAAPKITYLLGFSPQNLKLDGHFHSLKVSLTGKRPYKLQARNGYFAPRNAPDPAENAKQEIQESLFSQEEIRDLPVELHTQFFRKDQAEARVAVLAHVDLKGLRFRKAGGRNSNNLTFAAGIFDENGNFVTGGEKILEMKLLDTTYERLSHGGITVKSSFDVKPGNYLVRLVVRDTEGEQMAARNGAVAIPF